MPARLEFGVRFGSSREANPEQRQMGGPLHILVMGDFSGRPRTGAAGLADRPIHGIDIDVFDEVIRRMAPQLEVRVGASRHPIEFIELEDFHPDHLYRKLDVFRALRDLRKRISDPSTFDQAAEELMRAGLQPAPNAQQRETDAQPTAPSPESGAQTLERLLGSPSGSPGTESDQSPAGQSQIDALLRDIVAPHLSPTTAGDATPHLNAIDLAATEQMRAILHDTAFQSLEAGWRGIRQLVDNLDLDEALRLSVLDVSGDELIADALQANGTPGKSALHTLLVEKPGQPADDPPWSLIVGNYAFGTSQDDLRALQLMGSVGAGTGAAFLAAAAPALAGCQSLQRTPDPRDWKTPEAPVNDAWNDLRASDAAPFIGLAIPRILQRLPYGEKTDPIDVFEFDELTSSREHETFLWGNPAFACALLLGQSFMEDGWDMHSDTNLELEDLPSFSFDENGETRLMPCNEVHLSRHASEALQERGLMSFLSYSNRNAVRLMGFRSISTASRTLAPFNP